ncbi:hypothetical protein [Natronorubrum sulfidifaciens]|uniref:Uncharacterized protein n=1 Tax=Natronorubrum sulfidifaciens JCM 14089 TaxID=1230460 RepID=L9WCL0_9EURY|nr:hypothetical protein [Natronorubrum sulfidifaciens]ELY47240.1 hypothetical protein C495_03242 [Natronorubrum sulfidifaciens JCM 14089]
MADKKFTFIELHLDGETQFGPRALGDALPVGDDESATDTESELDTDDEATAADDSGGKAIGAIVALVVLVGVAVAAKKFRGDDESDLEAEAEPDVIVN